MNTLHVDSIIKNIGDRLLLSDIYFTCQTKEIKALFGRNGTGKSTLFKIITGIEHAEQKFIKVNRDIIIDVNTSYKKVNYLPQHHFIPKHLKIKDLIHLMCSEATLGKISNHPIIRESYNKKANQLSGGERRFIEVMVMIYSNSKFTLLDEPFNALSPIHKEYIQLAINDAASSKGFIITDHDYRSVLNLTQTTMLLTNGVLKQMRDPILLKQGGYL